MRKLLSILVLILLFTACNNKNDYVTFSGNIINKTIDSLIIFHPKTNFTKVIRLKEDGTFIDTLKVVNGMFSMTNGKDFTLLYLLNGDNISMSFDEKSFKNTVKFTQDHAIENNFLATSIANENILFADRELMRYPKDIFDQKVTEYTTSFKSRLKEEALDQAFVKYQEKEIVNFKNYLEKEYLEKNYNQLVLAKGKVSPKFVAYENVKGGVLSLDDLKGKYVYIDIWATWCKPCTREFPYLKKIEKKYHNKNIEFVSVSIDSKRDYETWKNMIKENDLEGIQLYAKGDQSFTSAYRVRSIPRFILIDPKGMIINANAPRPSSASLVPLLESLDL